MVTFYIGLHQVSDAKHFDRSFISVNRLRKRRSPFTIGDWIMDSGAFTEISQHGHYREGVDAYAAQIERWAGMGNLLAAVAQDYMCEPFILAITGLTVGDHQRLTLERYDALTALHLPVPILPVLQGYAPIDYVRHLRAYGLRLPPNAWVGVGSVCKRNGSPQDVANVLAAILSERPDLRLHGFGVKQTALLSPDVYARLHSADSMAWSWAARRQGRNQNDWREAKAYAATIERGAQQMPDELQLTFAMD